MIASLGTANRTSRIHVNCFTTTPKNKIPFRSQTYRVSAMCLGVVQLTCLVKNLCVHDLPVHPAEVSILVPLRWAQTLLRHLAGFLLYVGRVP
jgi:hypothetical protein